MPHFSQMSETLILENGICSINSFIAIASAFLVILESGISDTTPFLFFALYYIIYNSDTLFNCEFGTIKGSILLILIFTKVLQWHAHLYWYL